MRKQLLWLMYLLSKDVNLLRATVRETRNALKIVFKVPTRMTPKFEKSPFYIGTKLWDELSNNEQRAENVYVFKKEIDKLYSRYKDLLKING